MTRRAAFLAIGLLVASCTGPTVTTRPPDSGTSTVPRGSPAPPAPTETRAESITLVADLSAPPAGWERVATIPFGKGEEQLGFLLDPNVGSLASIPTSFVVAADGSFWVLDDLKERLAHYDPRGRYLGQVELHGAKGVTLRDVAPTTSGLAVLQEIHPLSSDRGLRVDSRIDFVDASRIGSSIVPRTQSSPVYVSLLFPWPEDLADDSVVGDVLAFSNLMGDPPMGRFARFAPDEGGRASFSPGLPLDVDLWAALEGTSDQDFDVTFITGDRSATQPIHVRVVPSSDARPLRAIVGPRVQVALPSGVGILVELAPSVARDADRYGGGRWYLQLGPTNEPLVWEPLRYGYHEQERQVRHLTGGPDGSVYLMVLTRHAEMIYRRP